MKSMKLKLFTALLLSAFLFVTSISALASENAEVNFDKKGSISIELKTEDTVVPGAGFTLYRVAKIEPTEKGVRYSYAREFDSFGGNPDDLQDSASIKRLAEYADKNKAVGIVKTTNEKGFAKFDDLNLGLYLIVQTGSVNKFSDCSPFLISLPTKQGGKWVYDIDASPKADIVKLVDITVKKVWSDDGKNRPKNVTMWLCKQGKIVDKAILNKANNWAHTWEDKPGGDSWSVRESVPKGYIASYKQNGYVFTVTNTAGLVQTGQLIWPIPVFAAAGILFLALGCYLLSRRENDHA